jgi:hypothetical protein
VLECWWRQPEIYRCCKLRTRVVEREHAFFFPLSLLSMESGRYLKASMSLLIVVAIKTKTRCFLGGRTTVGAGRGANTWIWFHYRLEDTGQN